MTDPLALTRKSSLGSAYGTVHRALGSQPAYSVGVGEVPVGPLRSSRFGFDSRRVHVTGRVATSGQSFHHRRHLLAIRTLVYR